MSNAAKYEAYYLSGNFDRCEVLIHQLLYKLDYHDDRSDGPTGSRPALETHPAGCDVQTWQWILENNIIVSKGLRLICNQSNSDEEWDHVTRALLDFHGKVKSFQYLGKIPIELYLNVVYNNLWWGWLNPFHNRAPSDSHWEVLFQIIIDCFTQVTEICKYPPVGNSFTSSEELCLELMKRTTNHFLRLELRHSVQLFEIYMLSIQILLESKRTHSSLAELCMFVVNSVCNTWPIFEITLKEYQQTERKDETINPKIFKFGFQNLNSTIENYDPQLLYEVVCILSSLCYICLGCLEQTLGFFYISPDRRKNVQLPFLWHYLQAYACYHLEELDACMLRMESLSALTLSGDLKARYQLMYGQLLSRMKSYKAAHEELGKALEMVQYQHTAVYYIITNMKHAVLNSSQKRDTDTRGTTHSPQLCSTCTKYRKALVCLYEFMESSTECNIAYNKLGFKEKILFKLHQHAEVRSAEVLYLISREMLKMKTFPDDEASTQPSRIIADCLVSTLAMAKMCEPMDSSKAPSCDQSMPPLRVLYHEAVAALLMDGQTTTAEAVCAIPIMHPLCQNTTDSRCNTEERVLFSLDEDLVALMLMANIKRHNEQYTEEAEVLNRCKKIILKHFFSDKMTKPDTQAASTHTPSLMDSLAARVYLMKALVHHRNNYKIDALENLERALQHNPGDPLVKQHYASMTSTSSEAAHTTPDSAVGQYSSIALQYLLGADTTFV